MLRTLNPTRDMLHTRADQHQFGLLRSGFLGLFEDNIQVLNRQGLYGDFFSFYLCDVSLKLNGKGGQPVYVKVAGQDTGRCTPR